MALIRECQPQTIDDWQQWYFENANPVRDSSSVEKENIQIPHAVRYADKFNNQFIYH
jgi:hypothetical protein